MSLYVETTGVGQLTEDADIEVHPDGTVTVLTGTSPHGQGHATAWAMIVSDQLGIPVEMITVIHGDTDLIPAGGGTAGSRSLQLGGAAVQQAAIEVVELAKQRAADLLEANPDDIVVDLTRARVQVIGSDQGFGFAELAGQDRLRAHTTFTAARPTFPFGAHLAVVEVDVETGKSVLQRIITVDDAGRVLNPLLCEGHRHGGIARGVAQALDEEMVYDDLGHPLTSTLADCSAISAVELPSFELLTMQTETPINPLGAKGIGEAATIGSTPAVLGASFMRYPILGCGTSRCRPRRTGCGSPSGPPRPIRRVPSLTTPWLSSCPSSCSARRCPPAARPNLPRRRETIVTAAPATSSESAFGLEVRRPGYCAAAERRGWRSSAASRSPSRRSVSSDSPRRGRRPAGVRAAVSFGPSPPQPGFFGDELARAAVSDDWLTVNVWSPDPGPGTGLPVLVWIPGGASVIGASSLPEFDGGRLAAGGVVVVTLNYRLGIEGFAQIECGPRPPACLPLTPGGCPARPWPSPGRSTGGRTAGHRP